MWFYFLIGALLIVLGLAVHQLKWYFLISGYNTMSKEKKAKVDTKSLGRLMGIYSYVNGGAFIFMGILYGFGITQITIPMMVFFGITTLYMIVKAQKYDGNIFDENGKLRKGAGKQLALPICISVGTLILVTVVLFFASQPTKVTILEEGLQIHGIYGKVYSWENIETANLMEKLPNIELRINGSALGSNLKGYFRTTEYGSVKLFVNTQNPPYIYLETDGKITIFNMTNSDETKAIFEEISTKMEFLNKSPFSNEIQSNR